MTEKWCKETLKDYISYLIDDLDDEEYSLDESRGRDFLRIEIERVKDEHIGWKRGDVE